MQEFPAYGNGFRMLSIFQTLIGILRLRASPADLPTSQPLLAAIFVLHAALQVFLALQFLPVRDSLPVEALVSGAFSLLWLRFVLQLFGRPERFLQTATAAFGVSCLIAPVSVPLAATVIPKSGVAVQLSPLLALVIVVGFYVVYVNARILREAIERSTTQCLLIFLAGDLLAGLIVFGFFGDGAVPAGAAARG
mgnify:FL=1